MLSVHPFWRADSAPRAVTRLGQCWGMTLTAVRGRRRYRACAMAYEWTAVCDACGTRQTFQIESFRDKFPHRPLPAGWMHVHEGGRPGEITPEIGVACSRACLAKARRILLAHRA